MEYPVVVKNIALSEATKEAYKYIVVRECENLSTGKVEYWYYGLYNDLYSCSMAIRETGNGIVLETKNVISKALMRKVRIYWDCDDDDAILPDIDEIPDEISDLEIADYLSDTYGWCVEAWYKLN